HPTVNDMIIVSIGTGIEARPYPFKSWKKQGNWLGKPDYRHFNVCQCRNSGLSAGTDVSNPGT
ncbi:hypothetical protein, partial [Chryseobacterium sp. CH1]|uniref:hypothetical protein n=1 Tax=Chryseobacterium sp. CH1 TaxID=713551 RepID=UPI001E2AFB4A